MLSAAVIYRHASAAVIYAHAEAFLRQHFYEFESFVRTQKIGGGDTAPNCFVARESILDFRKCCKSPT